MRTRRDRYSYTCVNLDTVTAITPYFSKLGSIGWELVAVDNGQAFFKRLRSNSIEEDLGDYVSYLKKELAKYNELEMALNSKEPKDSINLTQAVEEFL